MTPEEAAVINTALALHAENRYEQMPYLDDLDRAAEALIYSCSQCSGGGHICPGCGADVGHAGPLACTICQDAPSDPEHPRDPLPDEADVFVWVERPIADVRKGDVIRLAGRPETARRAYAVMPQANWHVHPKANQYRPNEMPAEWSEVKVAFNDYPESGDYFGFPPDTAVEIRVTERELYAINALGGFPNRLGVTEEK